ncbi:cupin domain-containing protein [Actibacterium pelagium]|uniref:Cupin domain-containing protein n=1 Tax=Actibacterium pelagium TaxID=2029103 RepID=A0A917AGD7_9RHOB|nr:cupin [Actibacterium pelagium]GGE51163.1 hypothetical protein GCM10011517_18700 [Actibacterium pelagium]
MEYLYLTEDADGVSYFKDKAFQLSLADFAPPAPAIYLSDPIKAERFVLVTLPAGWGGAKHPSPRRQIAFCLSGSLEVKAGDGDVRQITSGGIWHMEDVNGSGHTTHVVGSENVNLAIVQLD